MRGPQNSNLVKIKNRIEKNIENKKKFQLDEYNPKLFLNHTPTSKNSPLGPQKLKKKPKIKSKSKVIFKEIIENERCSTT